LLGYVYYKTGKRSFATTISAILLARLYVSRTVKSSQGENQIQHDLFLIIGAEDFGFGFVVHSGSYSQSVSQHISGAPAFPVTILPFLSDPEGESHYSGNVLVHIPGQELLGNIKASKMLPLIRVLYVPVLLVDEKPGVGMGMELLELSVPRIVPGLRQAWHGQ